MRMKMNSALLKSRYLMFLNITRNLSSFSSIAHAFNTKASRLQFYKSQYFEKSSGIFGWPELKNSDGYYRLKNNAISTAHDLIEEMKSSNRKRNMVRIFDELSDTLCKVADSSQCLRMLHTQKEFVRASDDVYFSVCNFFEELNTNGELYKKLKYVTENGDVCKTDPIDNYVAKLFLSDFEQSGIHLDEEKRREIVECNDYINHLGSSFVNERINPRAILNFFELKNVQPRFLIDNNPHKGLCELLRARKKLANLCGFPTYAHRAIQGSIAETPQFVNDFLTLVSMKINRKSEETNSTQPKLEVTENYSEDEAMLDHQASPYFSLGACMDGLNNIYASLFDVSLYVEECVNGEVWHQDVKKIAVKQRNNTLGWIYCDFFARDGKPDQDCHCTVQCARLCDDGSYQKPIVVLMLNLPSTVNPTLLNLDTLGNLFHEMGHAMHSILSNTRYQFVNGTRCSTDLAEVPSILMEYFASDPRVITTFAKHYKTGETIPLSLFNKLLKSKNRQSVIKLQLQVFDSTFDQMCHSLSCSGTDSLDRPQLDELPYIPNTTWQLTLSQLFGYGARYYSYLVARAVASWIWQDFFNKDPFNRSAGEVYRTELLAHGGSKHPRELVENLLKCKVTPESLSDALLRDMELRNRF